MLQCYFAAHISSCIRIYVCIHNELVIRLMGLKHMEKLPCSTEGSCLSLHIIAMHNSFDISVILSSIPCMSSAIMVISNTLYYMLTLYLHVIPLVGVHTVNPVEQI